MIDKWWSEFYFPEDEDPHEYLSARILEESLFDYVLSTDGSGHMNGCGAYASVIDYVEGYGTKNIGYKLGANIGSSVYRNEFTALLEGMAAVIEHNQLHGAEDHDGKIGVLWHTDRADLATSMMYYEDGRAISTSKTDLDLRASFRYLSKYVTVVPLHNKRNEVRNQALADWMCTLGYSYAKVFKEQISEYTELWNPKKLSQKGRRVKS